MASTQIVNPGDDTITGMPWGQGDPPPAPPIFRVADANKKGQEDHQTPAWAAPRAQRANCMNSLPQQTGTTADSLPDSLQ